MTTNPKSAIDAITASEETVGGITVYPVTIARYAILEMLGSPFVDPSKDFCMANIVPSLYVMCNDVKQIRGYSTSNIQKLCDVSMDWSEEHLDIRDVPDLIKRISDQFAQINTVAPESASSSDTKEDGKKIE